MVVQALARYTAQDATLTTVISNGLNTLNALVNATTSTSIQALSSQAAQAAGNTTLTTTFLSMLTTSQATTGISKGSWNADPYATALATSALALAANTSSLSAPVAIPDQALRRAINLALGRNAMDNLSQGQLRQLTALSAVGAGISDLTGLQLATNLASANFNNNNLTTIAPLSGLTQLASISWTGNPGSSSGSTQVPAVPLLGQLLMALGLFSVMTYFRRTRLTC
jgi:Leucine-rich repeat (LRR) protein